MKYLFILLSVFPFFAFSQSTITWSDTSTVISNAVYGYTRPKVAVTRNGVPVVMWGRSNNKEVFVSRWNGSGFNQPVQVTPNGVNAYIQSWVGPDMDASGDTVFVTFKSQPDNTGLIYIVKSIDGGNSFGDTVRVADVNWSRFPSVSVYNGNPVVAFMEFEPNFLEPWYVVSTSADGGNTFTDPVSGTNMAPGEACDCCPADVLVEAGRTMLSFRNNDHDLRDLWASVSTDGGTSFPSGKDIDNNNWIINSCPSTGPDAITVGNDLIAVWMSGASGFARVNVVQADLATLSVSYSSEIDTGAQGYQNYPKIAGDGNVLGVVWQEVGDGMDIFFAASTTGVEGLVNGDRNIVNLGTIGSQSNPDIAYENGNFHIVWQDDETDEVVYRKLSVDLSTGISEVTNESQVSLYPSPVTDRLYIDIHSSLLKVKDISIGVYDVHGRLVLESTHHPITELQISTNSLSGGMYFLSIISGGSNLLEKFLVE